MTTPDLLTADGIRSALEANDREPHGRARIVRAEALVDAADRLGDPALQIHALHEAIDAYQFGGERFRSPVPFARVLRLWDEHGSTLTHADYWSYRTHWKFKWLTSDLILIPEVPLATIRGFVDDMERRYRVAGYGMRAVHAQRFHIAKHLGDEAAAEAHHGDWLAAERETMSDCEACELASLGSWRAWQGDDGSALELWRRTLDGELTCMEEPGCTLADSLLPLVRLGRLDEARSHHLRGYRLVRGHPNLRSTIGQHIEFCALTGNEGRALEILADHRTWYDGPTEPVKQLDFVVAVAMLAQRLVDVGLDDLPMPGPDHRDWPARALLRRLEDEATALAARFDARNGNDAVSRRTVARLAQRPLLDALPLGVRSVVSATPSDSSRGTTAPADGTRERPQERPQDSVKSIAGRWERARDEDLAMLIYEARELAAVGHPDGGRAWERCAALAEAQGTALDPRAEADLWEQRGLTASMGEEWESAAEMTRRAADLCDGVGDAGHAVAMRARAVFCAAIADVTTIPDASAKIDSCHAQVEALHALGAAEPIDLLLSRHCQAAIAHLALSNLTVDPSEDADRAQDVWDEALGRFADVVELLLLDAARHGVGHRVAAGRRMRAEIAMHNDRPDDAVADLLQALSFERAHRPWLAMHTLVGLAHAYERIGLGGPARDDDALLRAIETAEESLSAAADWPGEDFAAGPVHVTLANLHEAFGRHEESIRWASSAASWADRNGEPAMAAAARFGLSQTQLRLGRPADAATVLEASMAQFVEHLNDETVVRARWTLGRALIELDDQRGAAEQFLLAAVVAETWPSQRTHAMLAADAAHALNAAGLTAQAQQAFEKAVDLLRLVNAPVQLAKTLRALAWTVFGAAQKLATETEDADEGPGLGAGGPDADAEDDTGHGIDGEPDVESILASALDRALLLFADAEQVLDTAFANTASTTGADDPPAFAAEIAYERAETQDQLARLHIEAELPEKALPYASQAAEWFRAELPDHAFDYDIAEQMTAWLLNRFSGPDAAIARLEQAIAVCLAAGVEAPRCVSYLEQVRS